MGGNFGQIQSSLLALTETRWEAGDDARQPQGLPKSQRVGAKKTSGDVSRSSFNVLDTQQPWPQLTGRQAAESRAWYFRPVIPRAAGDSGSNVWVFGCREAEPKPLCRVHSDT